MGWRDAKSSLQGRGTATRSGGVEGYGRVIPPSKVRTTRLCPSTPLRLRLRAVPLPCREDLDNLSHPAHRLFQLGQCLCLQLVDPRDRDIENPGDFGEVHFLDEVELDDQL